MPYCTSCGAAASNDARFCTKCGKQLQVLSSQVKGNEQEEKKAWFEEKLQSLESKVTCAYCIYRRPKNVCGAQDSPFFGQIIKHEDQCKAFVDNPAELHFIRAVFMEEYGDKFGLDQRRAVAEFRKAIDVRIPKDDELAARLRISKLLYTWTRSLHLDPQKWINLPETGQAISEMESALMLDHEGEFGFFAEPKHRYYLGQLDTMYAVKGALLSIEKGQGESTSDAAAIEYWEKKLPLCDYLSSNPLLQTLTDAGFSYSRLENTESAMKCFELVFTAAPVDPFDSDGSEAELRKRAKVAWQYLQEQSA